MAQAFIGLGSNLGDGKKNLRIAWQRLLEEAGRAVALSPPFLTEPQDMPSTNMFTNAVGVLETELPPYDLLARMMNVEAELGRDRKKGKDRIIDLDLLFYDDLVLNSASLTVPHPEIAKRAFVLFPLAAVSPLHVHPILHMTSLEMLNKLDRKTGVKLLAWENV